MRNKYKIALIFDTSQNYGRKILSGIMNYVRSHDPWELYGGSLIWRNKISIYIDYGDREHILPILTRWKADGLIVNKDLISDRIMAEFKLPVICLHGDDSSSVNAPSLAGDHFMIAKMAVDYYTNLGFRNFAYCGVDNYEWSRKRGHYFQQAVNASGYRLFYYKGSAKSQKKSWNEQIKSIAKWVKKLPEKTAMLCCNDEQAECVVKACEQADVIVPEDVAVLGIDNDEFICELSFPSISSICVNYEEAGYRAAEMLNAMLKGQTPEQPRILMKPTHVVSRESTNLYVIKDQTVVEAMQLIMEYAGRRIRVGDIANELAVSRRKLELKFRQHLGRTVHQQIMHARIEKVLLLLSDPAISISQIASMLDFDTPSHLTRQFTKSKGMTPRQYRKLIHR